MEDGEWKRKSCKNYFSHHASSGATARAGRKLASSTRRTSKIIKAMAHAINPPAALTESTKPVRCEEWFRVKLAGERDAAEKGIDGKRRQCGRPAEYFHETGHGQTIHHGFNRQQPEITERTFRRRQAIGHGSQQAQRRGAK